MHELYGANSALNQNVGHYKAASSGKSFKNGHFNMTAADGDFNLVCNLLEDGELILIPVRGINGMIHYIVQNIFRNIVERSFLGAESLLKGIAKLSEERVCRFILS